MSSYTNVFGGTTINPAFPSYGEINLTQEVTQLAWPTVYYEGDNIVSLNMSVDSDDDTFQLRMPAAGLVSVGQRLMIGNIGEFDFVLTDISGNEIVTILPTQVYFINLTNNTTEDGVWQSILLGATTAAANAAALAGMGLIALDSKLNVNVPTTFLTTSYIVTPLDRAKLLVWSGGTDNITLPDASAVGIGNGFLFYINNASEVGGVANLVPQVGQTIDGETIFTVNLRESGQIISDGANWHTTGFVRSVINIIEKLELTVTGGTLNLTQAQTQRQIMIFSGLLTSDVTIIVPPVINFYFVENQTTGGDFTFNYKVDGGTDNLIPKNARVEFYCDGTDMKSVPTYIKGSLAFDSGTEASPSIRFAPDPATGGYLNTAGNIGWSSSGVLKFNIGPLGVQVTPGTVANSAYGFLGEPSTGLSKPAVGQISISSQGIEALRITSTKISVVNPVNAAAYTFIGALATGMGGEATAMYFFTNGTKYLEYTQTSNLFSIPSGATWGSTTEALTKGSFQLNPVGTNYMSAAGLSLFQNNIRIFSTTPSGPVIDYQSGASNLRILTESTSDNAPMFYSDYLQVIG